MRYLVEFEGEDITPEEYKEFYEQLVAFVNHTHWSDKKYATAVAGPINSSGALLKEFEQSSTERR